MNTNFKTLLILSTVAAISFGVYLSRIPGSETIRAEISKALKSNESDGEKLPKIEILEYTLAQAYNRENRPDDAIAILKEKIKKNREPKHIYNGKYMPQKAANFILEEIYYTELARSFELKGDMEGKDEALKKSQAAAAEAERLRKIETAEKKRRDTAEIADLLN